MSVAYIHTVHTPCQHILRGLTTIQHPNFLSKYAHLWLEEIKKKKEKKKNKFVKLNLRIQFAKNYLVPSFIYSLLFKGGGGVSLCIELLNTVVYKDVRNYAVTLAKLCLSIIMT